MSIIKSDFTCPECKKKNRIKLNTLVSEDRIVDLISKEYFNIKCKNCNKDINILYPLTVEWDNYSVSFLEENKDSKKGIKRITKDYDDFKEKLLIFEENLNDILIEFLKYYIKEHLDEEKRTEVTVIRFNELRSDSLIFYLFNLDEYVKIDKTFYDNLENNAKTKDISKYIEVNELTFRKYFKL